MHINYDAFTHNGTEWIRDTSINHIVFTPSKRLYNRTLQQYIIYWEDIKDCMLRLKDYLGDRYVRFMYKDNKHKPGAPATWLELNEETKVDTPIKEAYITYKK